MGVYVDDILVLGADLVEVKKTIQGITDRWEMILGMWLRFWGFRYLGIVKSGHFESVRSCISKPWRANSIWESQSQSICQYQTTTPSLGLIKMKLKLTKGSTNVP